MVNKCLIIGLGQIGMGYDFNLEPAHYILSHAQAFSEHPEFELVGGVDSNKQRCIDFEEKFKTSLESSDSIRQAKEIKLHNKS